MAQVRTFFYFFKKTKKTKNLINKTKQNKRQETVLMNGAPLVRDRVADDAMQDDAYVYDVYYLDQTQVNDDDEPDGALLSEWVAWKMPLLFCWSILCVFRELKYLFECLIKLYVCV